MDYIKTRRSVRTYTGENLRAGDIEKINAYIRDEKNLIGINGNKINIELKHTSKNLDGKIGTYGFIKNAPAFLVVICKNDKSNMLDVGYVFEKLVLFLEQNGLGTCWLGGTFNRNQFDIKATFGDDAFIPIISPVGYAANKTTLTDIMLRRSAKSNSRHNFDSLFFSGDFNNKIVDESIRQTLEMVRLAPSASNKQPWRIVMDTDGTAHFYIERTANYVGGKLPFDIQWLDIGIAISHYEIASGKNNFAIDNPQIEMLSRNCEYVFSVE